MVIDSTLTYENRAARDASVSLAGREGGGEVGVGVGVGAGAPSGMTRAPKVRRQALFSAGVGGSAQVGLPRVVARVGALLCSFTLL